MDINKAVIRLINNDKINPENIRKWHKTLFHKFQCDLKMLLPKAKNI